jgi:uncharacterized membrane protein YoaK (UPF0700 family)
MDAGRAHGPLPVLLVNLTVVTGLVDAFDYLRVVGHVFVANMTASPSPSAPRRAVAGWYVGRRTGATCLAAAATQAWLARGSAVQLTLVALLAVAMGGQNAVARRLAVSDLTTTVLTVTVTGLVADATSWSGRVRRLLPVVAVLAGALVAVPCRAG